MPETSCKCPICKRAVELNEIGLKEFVGLNCPRCGRYAWSGNPVTARAVVDGRVSPLHARRAVSAWIQEQNLLGHTPTLDNSLFERAITVSQPGLIERSQRLLIECGNRTKIYNQNVFVPAAPLEVITWSDDQDELQSLADILREKGLLKKGAATEFRLTAVGLGEVEAKRRQVTTDQAFVAMSFASEMRSAYENGIRLGIRDSGYKPFRVDRHEHVNRIDEEIIAQIRRSRFLVADFTGQRPGVYFEAGFALGLGLEVIWSCRKDDICRLHFDIRQYNCIDWETEADLASRLRRRIEARLGVGPAVDQL